MSQAPLCPLQSIPQKLSPVFCGHTTTVVCVCVYTVPRLDLRTNSSYVGRRAAFWERRRRRRRKKTAKPSFCQQSHPPPPLKKKIIIIPRFAQPLSFPPLPLRLTAWKANSTRLRQSGDLSLSLYCCTFLHWY